MSSDTRNHRYTGTSSVKWTFMVRSPKDGIVTGGRVGSGRRFGVYLIKIVCVFQVL